VVDDEAQFAARQGYKVSEAWAEKTGLPEAALQRRGRTRKKGRFVKGEVERSPERVFLPGQKNPVVLRQNTSELHLLARLRDEAHRFAITFHRKLRRERNFRSVLEEIPGIADKRKRALLSHFGSLKRIRAATAEEIAQVEGFNAELADRVRRFLAAQDAVSEAEGGAELDGGAPPEAGAQDAALLSDREDVAFDAAAAELDELEGEEAEVEESGEPDQAPAETETP
jgi:excinuclease ABC subunit C